MDLEGCSSSRSDHVIGGAAARLGLESWSLLLNVPSDRDSYALNNDCSRVVDE